MINKIIRKLRKENKLNQSELAKKIGKGCDQKTISRWENGIFAPRNEHLLKLNEIFNGKLFEELNTPGVELSHD